MNSSPNLFIIGAPKAGTTALAMYLSEHPNVFFSAPKEPFYWDHDHTGNRDVHGLHSLDDYLRLFQAVEPSQHKIVAEGSTTYLQSHVAIDAICNFQPDAKFIVMLRNPVDVAYGMHGELRRHYRENISDFEEAWNAQELRKSGKRLPTNTNRIHQLFYRDVAMFSPQLHRLMSRVAPENRLIVMFETFVSETPEQYRRVLEFLGIADDGRTDFPRVNQARKYRFDALGRFYHSPPALLDAPMRLIRSRVMRTGGRMRRLLAKHVTVSQERTPLPKELRKRMIDDFRDDIYATSKMLDCDLSAWTAN